MAKNVVACCDGTANEFTKDRTNVVKLFFTLRNDPKKQVAYYHPGIGTMEPPGALTGLSKRLTHVADQAFGWGLDRDIRDAYIFIVNNFEEGDRLFLFGFSRGAYTVRAVASLSSPTRSGCSPASIEMALPHIMRRLERCLPFDSPTSSK